jgi:8-amino-7-oxononanoate synthase
MQMLDFTSALYLGLQHPSRTLPAWTSLTLGKPAALEDPPGARAVEQELAALTGCEGVLLVSSTLHAFFDLFAMFAGPGTAVFIDQSSYPISRWAAQHTTGSTTVRFRSHDADELRWALSRSQGVRPIIVTDGISPASGSKAPIAQYAYLAAQRGGLVLVDDTQALGVLGAPANGSCPYGIGGGGSVRSAGIPSDEVVLVSSLAKAFGVPVAMVGGSKRLIPGLRSNSLTRTHCSPPSVAVIEAAAQALCQNRRHGDGLRACLARNVACLRGGLNSLGVAASRSLFPVQPLRLAGNVALSVHSKLLLHGVRTVLQRSSSMGAQLSFLVTARHTPQEIANAMETLAHAIATETHSTVIGVTNYDSQS